MWAREYLAEHPADRHIINDSWTPSGPVHIGSFRSLVIHDVLLRILSEEKKSVKYLFGFDDFDPLDGIPDGVKIDFNQQMGQPLNKVSSPNPKAKSYAEYFAKEYQNFHSQLGVKPEYYLTSELYTSGKFNPAITKVLDQADKIRVIYAEVSGSTRDKNWHPLQVVCPNCGKVGTTEVYDWDGKEVSFRCRKDLVPWAVGCGFEGKVSPFDGRAKMPWRVEWAAKWDHFGVTIESAGKDHASRGGSYDVAEKVLAEVFKKPQVNRLAHEFFLLQGKKMGSSKGLGVTPSQLLEVIPPELFRFLIVRNRPEQAIEIDLKSDIIPRLYDEYDRCQEANLSKGDPDLSDYFYFSQVDSKKIDRVRKVRFTTVVNLLQLPSMAEELKKPEIAPRVSYAKAWLEKYAPSETKFLVQENLPDSVKKLPPESKKYLKVASVLIEGSSEELQAKLYQLSHDQGISASTAFASIYQALLGKDSGPRAGELIASLDRGFVKKRFLEAAE